MWSKELLIDIPKRDNAPKTALHIHMVSKNEMYLDNKPYIFMLPGGPGANHSHYKDYECLTENGNIVFFNPRG